MSPQHAVAAAAAALAEGIAALLHRVASHVRLPPPLNIFASLSRTLTRVIPLRANLRASPTRGHVRRRQAAEAGGGAAAPVG